jgi:hypothetical protein
MNAREVESAAADVERLRTAVWRSLVAGGVVAAIAAGAAPFSRWFAVALAAGAVVQLVAAGVRWLCRRERIERLALEPAAYTIPEVARFGARASALRERRHLARCLHALAHERGHPLELHLVARATRYAQQLESLARELASPTARVEPAIAVACRRLITRPVESPLYNPNLPEEDLRAVLSRIRAGISSAELTGGLTT